MVDSWTVPARLVSQLLFPVYITHFFENMIQDATSFRACRHMPLLQEINKRHSVFYAADVEPLLVLDMSAQRMTVKKSITLHPGPGLRLSTSHIVGRVKFYDSTMDLCSTQT